MGKPSGKKKKTSTAKHGDGTASKSTKSGGHNPTTKILDEDATIFVDMASDLKEEGNKLFQRRDYERALLNYEKAIKLIPKAHADVANLRSNIATCYMQMEPPDYYRAINECNFALEVSPRYSKALLKRARCFEALNRLDLACRDIDKVLSVEPNNMTALEISERVKQEMEEKGIVFDERSLEALAMPAVPVKEKSRKKKSHRKSVEKVEEKSGGDVKEEPARAVRAVKLVFGEDIRWAQVPANCSLPQLRDIVRGKFPGLKAVLVKYKDREGDLVTITTPEEVRWAEESVDPQGSLRLYIVEANPEHEPFSDETNALDRTQNNTSENGSIRSSRNEEERSFSTCIDDWIVQFAQLFKNHVGVDSDAYLDLHECSMKLYCEAIEDTVTSEEAQEVFQLAEDKFQEMAALALFNCGNIHMSRARKRLFLTEDSPPELVLEQVKSAYEWAREEYKKAGKKYEEALKVKSDFYEGFLALGQQKFEEAKLLWYYAIGSNLDLEAWPSDEILDLFNNVEDNMQKGTELWEEFEEQRLKGRSKPNKEDVLLQKVGLEQYIKDVSTDDAAEQASNMRSQINILWGTMLYERSVVEFKIDFPMWEECLMAAVEKFKLAGASATDIAVMMKNHCANETGQEGLGFKIAEIVQAWNEMYDAKRWLRGVPSFRLEPLFRRRVPKLHHVLEHL